MRTGLLNHFNSLISDNERLIKIYRSIYYLLSTKEGDLSRKILLLLEKREELEIELKKCAFYLMNSMDEKRCATTIFHFMPRLLNLELLARLNFKRTRENLIYLEEKKYLRKYLEYLYKENLSTSVFKLLLKYKRRQKSFN